LGNFKVQTWKTLPTLPSFRHSFFLFSVALVSLPVLVSTAAYVDHLEPFPPPSPTRRGAESDDRGGSDQGSQRLEPPIQEEEARTQGQEEEENGDQGEEEQEEQGAVEEGRGEIEMDANPSLTPPVVSGEEEGWQMVKQSVTWVESHESSGICKAGSSEDPQEVLGTGTCGDGGVASASESAPDPDRAREPDQGGPPDIVDPLYRQSSMFEACGCVGDVGSSRSRPGTVKEDRVGSQETATLTDVVFPPTNLSASSVTTISASTITRAAVADNTASPEDQGRREDQHTRNQQDDGAPAGSSETSVGTPLLFSAALVSCIPSLAIAIWQLWRFLVLQARHVCVCVVWGG